MSWSTDLVAMAEKIPPAFWGVVVGSLFSLGGVALTNRANARRLREQFAHDRNIRVKDRELALRKEVYLAAVEAVSAGFSAVGKFADLNIPDSKITEGFTDTAPALARVQIIATERTAEAANTVTSELNASFLKLFAMRIPLNIQKAQISLTDQEIASFSTERDRFVEMMKQYNLEGGIDQRRWQIIEGNFKFEQERITECLQKRNALMAALYVGQLELAEAAFGELRRLTALMPPLVSAVRGELDLPIDEASYSRIVLATMDKLSADVESYLKQVRALSVPPAEAGAAVE